MSRTTRFTRHAIAVGLVIGAGAATAAPAQALVVATGPEGLQMREPNNTLNRVTLALVDSGGATKYRVEMPQFGGRGLQSGPGCVQEEPRPGLDVAICDRVAPKVSVSLGPMDDTFVVDPSFPDPIQAFGGLGADRIVLGAGDDTLLSSSGGGTVDGNGGNDALTSISDSTLNGGDGDDVLTGGAGTVIDGGPGNDNLVMGRPDLDLARGGEGTDTFTGEGSARVVDARDGNAEVVACGLRSNRFAQRFTFAIVDLVDTPDDAGMAASGCSNVDRAPANETTSVQLKNRTVQMRAGKAQLQIRCTTKRACVGRAWVSVGGKRGTVAYRIAGRTTKTVRVPAAGNAKTAKVTISEKGKKGARTIRATLTTKR